MTNILEVEQLKKHFPIRRGILRKVVGQVKVGPYGRAHLRVPIAPTAGTSECRVVYTVELTAVPAKIPGGANPDPRELGANFDRFFYEPAT